MLKIQTYLKKNGIDKTVEDFKLIYRDYGHKFLIKYNMIESDFVHQEVRESRGLILKKETYDILSMNFIRFFNHGEQYACKVDWDSANILEKLDGTLIQLYYDDVLDKWCTGTSGSAEGEGEVNNKYGTTFSDLFWNTLKVMNINVDRFKRKLNKHFVYIFELTTPYNIVVTPHSESKVTLLTVRDRHNYSGGIGQDMEEVSRTNLELESYSLNVPLVKEFKFKNKGIQTLLNTFKDMPYSEEGYVVVDDKFNRIKIKNPAYLSVHHLKNKTAEHNIMEVIKLNEIDEFVATLSERKEELYKLKESYDLLFYKLKEVWDDIEKPKNITREERKKYSERVFKLCEQNNIKEFTGLYFGLLDGKVESINEYLLNYDNKKLYYLL